MRTATEANGDAQPRDAHEAASRYIRIDAQQDARAVYFSDPQVFAEIRARKDTF